jgi:hypothetical protein
MLHLGLLVFCALLGSGLTTAQSEETQTRAAQTPSNSSPESVFTCPHCGGHFTAEGRCPYCGLELLRVEGCNACLARYAEAGQCAACECAACKGQPVCRTCEELKTKAPKTPMRRGRKAASPIVLSAR